MEIIVLTALLFKEAAALKTQKIRQLSTALILLALCACCVSHTGKSVRAVQEEYSRREEVNTAYESLLSYTYSRSIWNRYSRSGRGGCEYPDAVSEPGERADFRHPYGDAAGQYRGSR